MNRRDMLRASGAAVLGLSAFPLRWAAAVDKKPQKVLCFTCFFLSITTLAASASLQSAEAVADGPGGKQAATKRAAANEQSSTTTPKSKAEPWWQARQKAINERVKQGKIDLIFVGDSITQRWEGPGKAVWEKFYAKRNAANLGISADRTQHVLWRLDHGNLDGISPKLAVVMIGTNNAAQNSSQQIAAGIKAIVAKLRARLPETKVLLLAIFPRGPDRNYRLRQVNTKTNEIIATLADDKNIFFLDINARFLDADGNLSRSIMYDLLHPTAKGYQIWAEAIEPTVIKLMGEKPQQITP